MIHINLAMSILIISKAQTRELPMLLGMTWMQQTCNMSGINKLISHQQFGLWGISPSRKLHTPFMQLAAAQVLARWVLCMHTSYTRVPVIAISSSESMIVEANSTDRLL